MGKVHNISHPGGIIKHGRRFPKSYKYPEKNKKYASPVKPEEVDPTSLKSNWPERFNGPPCQGGSCTPK